MVLFPAINSNKDFIKYAVFYAHCGLKIMVRWTPGSKNLIPAINSNKDFIKYAVFFLLTVDLKSFNGPFNGWAPESKVSIPSVNAST